MDPLYDKDRAERKALWNALKEYHDTRKLFVNVGKATVAEPWQPVVIAHVEQGSGVKGSKPLRLCYPELVLQKCCADVDAYRILSPRSITGDPRDVEGHSSDLSRLHYARIDPHVGTWLCAFCGTDINEHSWSSFHSKKDGAITPRWQPSFCTLHRILDRVAQDFFPERRVFLDVEQSHWTPSEWSDHVRLIFHELDERGNLVCTTCLELQQRDPNDGGFPSFEAAFPSLMSRQMPSFKYSTPAMDVHKQLRSLKGWVQACDRKKRDYREDYDCEIHDSCRTETNQPIPSARIIDLADATAGTVRVVDTANLSGNYVALSWCWGHPSTYPLTSTKATLMDRMSGIAVSDLPRTFRDAIRVCLYLGIRFLWIDCLCIIQDDSADWSVEAEKMARIYSQSYLTIAATRAQNSQHGFLFDFVADTVSYEIKADAPWDNDAPDRDFFATFQINHDRSKKESSPLDRRCWCLQEWYLPTRLVEFCLNDIRFVCLTSVETRFGRTSDEATKTRTIVGFGLRDEGFQRRLWEKIVRWDFFSDRKITKLSDALPAIAGLAEIFEKRLFGVEGHRYLAGLWSTRIAEDLSWSVIDYDDEAKAIPGRPTWSWASVATHFRFDYLKPSATFVEIVEANCSGYARPKETLPSLTVRGFVKTLYLRVDHQDGNEYFADSHNRPHMSLWRKPYTAMTTPTAVINERVKSGEISEGPGFILMDMAIRPAAHGHETNAVSSSTNMRAVPSITRASAQHDPCSICMQHGYLAPVQLLLLMKTDAVVTAIILAPVSSEQDPRVREGETVYQRLALYEIGVHRQPWVATQDGLKVSWDFFWNIKRPASRKTITLI